MSAAIPEAGIVTGTRNADLNFWETFESHDIAILRRGFFFIDFSYFI